MAASTAQPLERATGDFAALLQAVVRPPVRGALARIEDQDGRLIWEGATGAARADVHAPTTPAMRFHVASIGKTMTATLVLQLWEEGVLDIDAPLSNAGAFAPSIVRRLQPLGEPTPRHLLTHTAGLRDAITDDATTLGNAPGSLAGRLQAPGADIGRAWRPWDAERPDEAGAGVVNFFLANGIAAAPVGRPGERFHYSDTGYVLLALIAEHAAGRPYHNLLRERIFGPLGLSAYLAYRDDPVGLGDARAPESEVWSGGLPMLAGGVNLSFDWGGGGVVATAADLAAFLAALLAGRLYRRPATLAAMTAFTTAPGLAHPRTGIGLGLFRTARPGGELWGHSGAWGGRLWRDPASGITFAGSANQTAAPADWHVPFVARAIEEAACRRPLKP